MSITATVDGTSYSGITTITTGGKIIALTESGGGSLPSGVSEIKAGSFSHESDVTSGTVDIAHGCSSAPDIIVVYASNYKSYYNANNHPAATTMVGYSYDAHTIKSSSAVGTSYEGTSGPTSKYTGDLSETGEGIITAVNETNFTIKTHSTRRLGGGLTYKWIAIVTA